MQFSSIFFVLIFLPIALGIYYLVKFLSKNNLKAKNITLFLLSILFYLFGTTLLFFAITIAYLLVIYSLGFLVNKKRNKWLLVLYLSLTLSYLITFKILEVTISGIILALAISFICFQSYSYLVDIYREKIVPEKNPITFITYSLLFTKLVSGPIMRYSSIKEQLDDRNENSKDFIDGFIRFAVGLFKKVIIAGFIYAVQAEIIGLGSIYLSPQVAWLGILSYAIYIYYDFSSYSDMAIGISKMFGFKVIENFIYPYTSLSITDFWRRWHISLSLWFKEYVYFPLGGNRKGLPRTLLNVFIIFMLTGIWHGFTWNFLIWGVYFGIVMVIEKLFLLKYLDKCKFKPLNVLYCFLVIIIGWVFFVTKTPKEAFNYIGVMFGKASTPFYSMLHFLSVKFIVSFILGFLLIGFIQRPLLPTLNKYRENNIWRVLTFVFAVVLCFVSIVFMINGSYSPSIYGGF